MQAEQKPADDYICIFHFPYHAKPDNEYNELERYTNHYYAKHPHFTAQEVIEDIVDCDSENKNYIIDDESLNRTIKPNSTVRLVFNGHGDTCSIGDFDNIDQMDNFLQDLAKTLNQPKLIKLKVRSCDSGIETDNTTFAEQLAIRLSRYCQCDVTYKGSNGNLHCIDSHKSFIVIQDTDDKSTKTEINNIIQQTKIDLAMEISTRRSKISKKHYIETIIRDIEDENPALFQLLSNPQFRTGIVKYHIPKQQIKNDSIKKSTGKSQNEQSFVSQNDQILNQNCNNSQTQIPSFNIIQNTSDPQTQANQGHSLNIDELTHLAQTTEGQQILNDLQQTLSDIKKYRNKHKTSKSKSRH